VEENHYTFVNNREGVCAAVEAFLGCQKGRLSQLEGFNAIMDYEIEWLRKTNAKYSESLSE